MLFPIPRYPVLRVILSLETFLDINVPRPEGQLKQGMRTSKFKFSLLQEPLSKSQDLVPPELRARRPGEARHPRAGPHCPRV